MGAGERQLQLNIALGKEQEGRIWKEEAICVVKHMSYIFGYLFSTLILVIRVHPGLIQDFFL